VEDRRQRVVAVLPRGSDEALEVTLAGTRTVTDGGDIAVEVMAATPDGADTSTKTCRSAQNLHSICAAPSHPLSTLGG
jgi:hypothetical protein